MRHLFKTPIHTFLLFIFIMLSLAVHAQQSHFIYIQADDKQPFSVQLNGKYYSSSAIGYIILPKLTDGTYNLEINFAKNSYPEQHFTLNVAGKDYGYALKNFDDKGWGLFNFQTTGITMSNAAAPAENAGANVTTNTSAFGNMLADVVNDKSINTLSATDTTTATAKANTPAVTNNGASTAAATNLADTVAATLDTEKNTVTKNDDDAKATDSLSNIAKADTTTDEDTTAFNTTGVIKAEENIGEKGTDLTFVDFNGTHSDTIKAFIPAAGNEKQGSAKSRDTLDVTAKAATADSATGGKVNNPFFGQSNTAVNEGKDTSATTAEVKPNLVGNNNGAATSPTSTSLVNSTCSNMLSDGDLNKLKRRIITQTDQEAILQTVKKSLKNKCVTTAQVKDLGNFFLNDDNRYAFYETAYPFVYDYGNYTSLQSTLIDPQYKSRFKALLR